MLSKLRGKLTGKKDKAVRWFAGFLVFMLACTITSRGIYAWQMPQVETAKAEQRALPQKIEVSGTVESQSEQAVVTEPGLRVKKVCVQNGESVEAGTVLFELDTDELSEQTELLKQELEAEQTKLQEQKNSQSVTEKQKQTQKERASADYASVTQTQEANVAAAQAEYDKVYTVYQSYPAVEVYLEDAKTKSTEYQTMKSAAEKAETTEEEKQAFVAYDTAFDISTRQSWSEGKASIEAELATKEKSLNDAKAAKDEAVTNAARAIEDADDTVTEESGIMTQENLVAEKQLEYDRYQALMDAGGQVSSETEGTIKMVNVSAGEKTPEGAAVTLSDLSEGYLFSAELTEEQKKYVNAGDSVTLKFKSGAVTVEDVPVSILTKNQDNTYHAAVKFTSDKVVLGESGTIDVTTNPEKSDCCVPLSALYASGNTNYVLILREKETILGTEYYVEQQSVVIEEKNEAYAALKDRPVGEEEEVVIWSDRVVSPGDTVRLKETE